MPEENDVDKTIYKVNRIPGRKDLYEDIPSHAESEREEDRKGGPRAPMKDREGPVVLDPSTYVDEDRSLDKEKRRSPEEQKKRYPPGKVPKDEYAAFHK